MAKLNARIVTLHDTEENWNKLIDFIPNSGESICYEPDINHTYVRLKLGDGKTKLKDLPFINETMLDDIISWEEDIGYLDSGKINTYKKLTFKQFTLMDKGCEFKNDSTWSQWVYSLFPKLSGFTYVNIIGNNVVIEGTTLQNVLPTDTIVENGNYNENGLNINS